MKLFFRKSGSGKPLLILHGLFGSSDNWFTLARTFSQQFSVYLIDQRNHGQSPHSSDFSYNLLAEDIRNFILEHSLNQPIILGHSMGGKAAMNFAVHYSEHISKLIVVDIVPREYPVHHDAILDGLKAIPVDSLTSRNEADRILSHYVPEAEVRQFLLKNLNRKSLGGFDWKINLKSIDDHIEAMGAGMIYSGKHEGSSLFIRGKKSNYYAPGDKALISGIFPNAEFAELDTGHWVQAEKPEEFAELVLKYLAR